MSVPDKCNLGCDMTYFLSAIEISFFMEPDIMRDRKSQIRRKLIYSSRRLHLLSFQNISLWKLAIIFIVAGIVIILALLGSSAKNLFSPPITEQVHVMLKKDNNCIVEPSDGIPRVISNCEYAVGDNLSVAYKPKQPTLEKYELINSSSS